MIINEFFLCYSFKQTICLPFTTIYILIEFFTKLLFPKLIVANKTLIFNFIGFNKFIHVGKTCFFLQVLVFYKIITLV